LYRAIRFAAGNFVFFPTIRFVKLLCIRVIVVYDTLAYYYIFYYNRSGTTIVLQS